MERQIAQLKGLQEFKSCSPNPSLSWRRLVPFMILSLFPLVAHSDVYPPTRTYYAAIDSIPGNFFNSPYPDFASAAQAIADAYIPPTGAIKKEGWSIALGTNACNQGNAEPLAGGEYFSVSILGYYQIPDGRVFCSPGGMVVVKSSCPYGGLLLVGAPYYLGICVRQNAYTITLSGGTEVEPWHKKWDKDHKTSNLTYTATVKNSSGQAAPGIQVTIVSDVTQGSGGHVHTAGRLKGKLVIPPESVGDGKETIEGKTDSNGVFSFTFGAEEASGEHKLQATCVGCKEPVIAPISVAIKGLMLLDSAPLNYELRGSLTEHPDNHYFSPAAMVKIINLAHTYLNDPDFKQLLKINDSSLIKGGTFDLIQDWTSLSDMHGGHRKGMVVDINNYSIQSPRFERFATGLGIDARWHSGGTAPHYHLLLLGEDR